MPDCRIRIAGLEPIYRRPPRTTRKGYAGITCEVVEGISPHINAVIFNYPSSVQLTAEMKSARLDKDSLWKALNLAASDTDAHHPQWLYIYEKEVVGNLERRQLTRQRSVEGKKKRNRKKRDRKPKAKSACCKQ